MNILIFIAGVSVGWVADKLYHSYIANKKHESEEVVTEGASMVEVSTVKDERHDDLSQLKGVGPKLVEALDTIGIYNYEQLSKPSVDTLVEKLRETGGRFSRSVISAVVEQAKQVQTVEE